MIGKPYTGKPSVRFDEGELEIGPIGHYASSLLYCTKHLTKVSYSVSLMKKAIEPEKV
jgi:hypothetical protein